MPEMHGGQARTSNRKPRKGHADLEQEQEKKGGKKIEVRKKIRLIN